MERHMPLFTGLVTSILTTPGDTDPALRRTIEARSAELGGRRDQPAPEEIPAALHAYVDKVARHAYKVTERDIDELKQAGYSEDAILEITLSAALGAGMARLERGLAALRGAASRGEEDPCG
jgi:alkylhydroperoxidase family enzyme